MNQKNLPVTIYQLALLQAYLYEMFHNKKECETNFDLTEWYLKENFTSQEIQQVLKFFEEKELNCDCDIITKLDLRDYSKAIIKIHK